MYDTNMVPGTKYICHSLYEFCGKAALRQLVHLIYSNASLYTDMS